MKRHVAIDTHPLPALAALEIDVLQLTKRIFALWSSNSKKGFGRMVVLCSLFCVEFELKTIINYLVI